jgi:hypothetical protein
MKWGWVKRALRWLTNHKDKLPLPGVVKDGLQAGRDAGFWRKGQGPKF